MSPLFIQYIASGGQVEEISVDLDPEVKKKAFALTAAGFRFEVQHLTRLPGNRVYFAIVQGEVVLGNAICKDGPKVPKAVTKMIDKSHTRWMKGRRLK